MKSRWVEHKGKRIFISDYSNFGTSANALQNEADAVIATFTKEPINSALSITNVEGTRATTQILQILLDVLPHTNKVTMKRTVVGADGLRWTFVEAFNKLAGSAPFKLFNSLEEAMDWIVQE